jgi:hypothetical protein
MYDKKYDPKKEWVTDSEEKAEGGQQMPDLDKPKVMDLSTPRGNVKVNPGPYQNKI